MNEYVSKLAGAAFHKTVSLVGNDHLLITYYTSYEQFIKDQEESQITEEMYKQYYSDSKEDKILVGEPARLLREFPELNRVTLETPNKHVHIGRTALKKYIGFDITELIPKSTDWIEFVNKYIYNEEERNKYLDHFECRFKQ